MQENIQMPIPMDKLKEMANRMNQILTNLLVSCLTMVNHFIVKTC